MDCLKDKRIGAKQYIYIYWLLVSRKKYLFFRKYLAEKIASQQTFPGHKQRMETKTTDVFCQLIFHNFEVFFNET